MADFAALIMESLVSKVGLGDCAGEFAKMREIARNVTYGVYHINVVSLQTIINSIHLLG